MSKDPSWVPFRRADAYRRPNGETFAVPFGWHLYANHKYLVFSSKVPYLEDDKEGYVRHLVIRRHDGAPAREWRDLQRIKNELCGPEMEAVELFPAESRRLDASNDVHLYVVELAAFRFPWGATFRQVLSPREAQREGLRTMNPHLLDTKQEPFEEADPYGPGYQP